MATFTLSIVTPEHILFEEEVESIVVPGAQGYLGVLAHHAPLITPIVPGRLTVRKSSNTDIIMAMSGGFLEVSHNKATVLADAVEYADEIDIERAKQTLERVRARFRDKPEGFDFDRALASMKRAENRLQICETIAVDRR
jgi:F-type H+-transporting ATPase subunit epsilon